MTSGYYVQETYRVDRPFRYARKEDSERMARGRVKWYSAALGHGFIVPDDGGAEAFVREEDIAGDGVKHLENDAEVTYEIVQGREGPEARNVSKV